MDKIDVAMIREGAAAIQAEAKAEPLTDARLDELRADVGTGVHRDLYNRIVRHALAAIKEPLSDEQAETPSDYELWTRMPRHRQMATSLENIADVRAALAIRAIPAEQAEEVGREA